MVPKRSSPFSARTLSSCRSAKRERTCPREVGREVEPGDLMDALGMRRQFPQAASPRTSCRRWPGRPVLRCGVPQNGGLALVGDGDGGDVFRARLVDEAVDERLHVAPDLRGIVLDAAGAG